MKNVNLSTRNLLSGKVMGVEKGIITARVRMEIESLATVTAVIARYRDSKKTEA